MGLSFLCVYARQAGPLSGPSPHRPPHPHTDVHGSTTATPSLTSRRATPLPRCFAYTLLKKLRSRAAKTAPRLFTTPTLFYLHARTYLPFTHTSR